MRFQDMIFLLGTSWAGLGLAITGALKVIPEPVTQNYFEVRSVAAQRAGDTAVLTINRAIHAPIVMSFTVRIMEEVEGGWRQFCHMDAEPFEYRPEAVLPPNIDLDWWTHGECKTLPAGPARIITTWSPTDKTMNPVTVITEVKG